MVAELIKLYHDECDAAGWTPSGDDILYRGFIAVAESDAEAAEMGARLMPGARPPMPPREVGTGFGSLQFSGSAATVIGQIEAFQKATGAGILDLAFGGGGFGPEGTLASLRRFGHPGAAEDPEPLASCVGFSTDHPPIGVGYPFRAVIYAFGEHELDEARFELRRAGTRVELQPKALQLLFFLVRNRDRALSKHEILDAVWPGTTVTDNSLARAVRLARVAISTVNGAMPIVTVPRRGYRFAAEVRTVSAPPLADRGPARYVGRAELLEHLSQALDRALCGAGGVLVLVGEAGIGKTRTAEVLRDRARESGALVGAAWGMEGPLPTYALWARALDPLLSSIPEPLRANLAPVLPDGRKRTGRASEAARFRLFEAVRQVLVEAAARRPLALVLDDLHEVDAESLWLLESVAQAIGELPIAILATCREEDARRTPQQARAWERLLRLGSVQRWPLVGLPDPEVREFVRTRLDREPDASLVEALAHTTGGNPLLLGESLRSLDALGLLGSARDAKAWEELLPAGIHHLLRPKLAQLSPAATDMLACAAAIGLEFDRALLARCVDDASQLERCVREGLAAGLLRPGTGASLRFPHPLVRAALAAELLSRDDARRTVHARVSAAVDSAPFAESLAVRAHHACEAAPLVEPARAAALARAAGDDAARLCDFEGASRWYGRALAVLELRADADRALVVELLLSLAEAQVRAAGLERGRATYRVAAARARALGRGDLLAGSALGLAREPQQDGVQHEWIEVLEEALRAVPAGERALRIRVQSRLGAELRHTDRARGVAQIDAAVTEARELADPAVLARTLEDALYVRWIPEDPAASIALNREIARAAREAGDFELALLAQRSCVASLLELGDIAGVDREIRACERSADILRTPNARWQQTVLRAMRALVDADLLTAERDVQLALQLGERLDESFVSLQLLLQLAYLRLEQGRGAEIEQGAREQARRFPDMVAWRAGVARILVTAGRLDEARQELGRLSRHGFADVPRDRGWTIALALASEVAFATGDTRTAELLEPLLTPCAALCVSGGSGLVFYGPVRHHLGLLALTRSRWDEALAHFEGALDLEERFGARIWLARTQLACARALFARGGTERARAERLVADASAAARRFGLGDIAADAAQLASRALPERSYFMTGGLSTAASEETRE